MTLQIYSKTELYRKLKRQFMTKKLLHLTKFEENAAGLQG